MHVSISPISYLSTATMITITCVLKGRYIGRSTCECGTFNPHPPSEKKLLASNFRLIWGESWRFLRTKKMHKWKWLLIAVIMQRFNYGLFFNFHKLEMTCNLWAFFKSWMYSSTVFRDCLWLYSMHTNTKYSIKASFLFYSFPETFFTEYTQFRL